jgi:hypothetical protein
MDERLEKEDEGERLGSGIIRGHAGHPKFGNKNAGC